MSNSFDTMRAALAEARCANKAADEYASAMAEMLVGRLHRVSPHTLTKLKRELRDFDMHRKAWKP